MTLSSRIWRQSVYRYDFLGPLVWFLLLSDPERQTFECRGQVESQVAQRHAVEAGEVG